MEKKQWRATDGTSAKRSGSQEPAQPVYKPQMSGRMVPLTPEEEPHMSEQMVPLTPEEKLQMSGRMVPLETEEKLRKQEERRRREEPPTLGVGEQRGNALTHGIGAVLSVAATVLMLRKAATGMETVSALVYGVCMTLLFSMSCVYHSLPVGSRIKRIWRRLDYASIYLLIGGTFTPLVLLCLGGIPGIAVCLVLWALLVPGIVLLSVFGPGRFRKLHFALYFSIGWSGILFMPLLYRYSPALMLFVLVGGAIYTFGMIPFCKKGKKNMHLLWHFFVLAAAALHWAGIFTYCL